MDVLPEQGQLGGARLELLLLTYTDRPSLISIIDASSQARISVRA